MNIFLSHSHSDKVLADALSHLLNGLFGKRVQVRYSSDRSAGGGIQPGESWLQWIFTQVKDANVTIVMCTPESVDKPWLMWESGAVSGAALASKNGDQPSLTVPVIYRLGYDEIPSPLRSLQVVPGENTAEIRRLLEMLHHRLEEFVPEVAFSVTCEKLIAEYLQTVQSWLNTRPRHRESSCLEWIDRLDELKHQKRFSEVASYHQLIDLFFLGKEHQGSAFIDERIHRRMGDLYLASRQGAQAVEQFQLAMVADVGNHDVFLLHRLGLAQLEAGNLGEAAKVVERIENVSETLVQENPEIAGLKGRVYRSLWKQTNKREHLRTARDAYWNAMEKMPSSYYMADNAGQLSLALNEEDKARQAYQRCIEAIESSHDQSEWAYASGATAAIVLGQPDKALVCLQRIADLRPDPRTVESIGDGLKRLKESLSVAQETYNQWIDALQGTTPKPTPKPRQRNPKK